ncbi:cora-domain-containing protein [Violaceomyces palustris]|uniref:Cora-domain-containing protein n=1 Tax=Violaceomyces palustris TaxID=1673888 RepID=A0ACD0P1W1_9BASI|nr:cora-domain-containing protein [Violaceomyces palustris]
MSSPHRHFVGSSGSGRAVSPDLSVHSQHSGSLSAADEDAQLQQDIDAARQMSMARNVPPSPSQLHSRRDDRGAEAEPYYAEGIERSPAAGISARPSAVVAANARFYQHNRQGSNTSLDSQQHFIDHRNQAHSLSVHGQSPIAARVSRRASQLGQTPLRSPAGYFNRTRAEDLDEDAIEDDTPDLDEGASGLRSDRRSGPSAGSVAELYGGARASSPHTMSRRPSMLEDDVCFPMHENEGPSEPQDHGPYDGEQGYDSQERHMPPGYPFNFDLQALEDFALEERERIGNSASWSNVEPSPEGMRMRANGTQTKASGGAYGISPDSDDATFYSRRPRKFSSSAGPIGSSRYQRKLALFEGGGSAPPPIAGSGAGSSILGNGTLLTAERSKGQGPSDAKTPLLDKDTLPSYHGTSHGESGSHRGWPNRTHSQSALGASMGGGRSRSQTGVLSHQEKPYRFTFYSNALPSTIHARHLAELPAEGQTFEELFSGRNLSSENVGNDTATSAAGNNGESARKPDSKGPSRTPTLYQGKIAGAGLTVTGSGRVEGATAPPSGANTPVQASEVQSSGTKPLGGISATRMAMNNASGRALPGGGIRMDQDPEANTWWLDVLSPTDQEMKLLSRVFGIHPLTTEDILMEETREKIELFRNYYLVCFRSFDQDPYSPTYLEPLNMYIIVFREGTLSFHFRGTPHPQNVRRRIKQLKDYINVTSDWISYALIDDITDAFGPLIQSIEYEVDSIDELVLILKEAEQSDMLRRIGTCRKKVMGLLRLMGNKADVVKGLAKRCNENWSVAPKSDIGLYLSDIQDHLITMTQNLNHYEKILSRSHSNYLAQISIEMTDANNQINDVLSKLTALGTVIVPMNVITGLWGMNVNVPGEGIPNLRWFAGICSVMVVLAVSGYIATTRYLERSR